MMGAANYLHRAPPRDGASSASSPHDVPLDWWSQVNNCPK
jgi:hypothetical protein